jgi:SOS response associated peptidase (SRAP)
MEIRSTHGNPLDERGEIIEHIDGSIAQPLDRLLLRGCGARREIPHEIWRRTIQSKAPRPWLELGAVVQGRSLSTYIAEMCGRFTRNYTWEQIHALYRLTAPAAIPNLQPRFNACPTDPADTIVDHEGKRQLVEMRWGLVPFWWNSCLPLSSTEGRDPTICQSVSSNDRTALN